MENEVTYETLKELYGEVDIKNNFNPYRYKANIEPYMGGYQIIFMTTPQMNIFDDGTGSSSDGATRKEQGERNIEQSLNDVENGLNNTAHYYGSLCKTLSNASTIFSYYNQTENDLLKSLTYGASVGGTTSPWIIFLTNLFKGLSLKDLNMRTTEGYETYYGWKQILPGPNIDSYSADTLTVTFDETKNLDVTKFHYLWMEYIEAVRYGFHKPTNQMRNRRTLDYTSSLYHFILDADFSKILYFTKYTGIYPTTVPLSSLSTGDISSKGPVDISITYAYQYKEELRPTVIWDFNSVAQFSHKIVAYGQSTATSDSYATELASYGYGNINKGSQKALHSMDNKRIFKSVKIIRMNNTDFEDNDNEATVKESFHLLFTDEETRGFQQDYSEMYGNSWDKAVAENEIYKNAINVTQKYMDMAVNKYYDIAPDVEQQLYNKFAETHDMEDEDTIRALRFASQLGFPVSELDPQAMEIIEEKMPRTVYDAFRDYKNEIDNTVENYKDTGNEILNIYQSGTEEATEKYLITMEKIANTKDILADFAIT